MSKLSDTIIPLLPYQEPFSFVDEIISAKENYFTGSYTLKEDEFFYKGHFPGHPVTPGAIIIEIMAQIGLVGFGIYLLQREGKLPESNTLPIFTSSQVDFYSPAYPGDKLEVRSKKIYYRFGKLKCHVECIKVSSNVLIAKGDLSGIITDVNKT